METASLDFTVTRPDTAAALGSGDLPVLGTPRLLAWCEAATCRAAEELLEPGQTSVGTRVQLEHLVPSALGDRIEVRAVLVHRDGRLLEFEVTALGRDAPGERDAAALADTSGGRPVATGRVRRIIVERDRFLGRLTR